MIKLNDLLHLTDEQASKAKVKFNRDNGYDDPIDIYKSNPDLINNGYIGEIRTDILMLGKLRYAS